MYNNMFISRISIRKWVSYCIHAYVFLFIFWIYWNLKGFATLIINNYNFFSVGHTHGGQFPPVVFGAYLFNPFYAGLYHYGDNSHVYVSMGTVYWGFPVRIMTMQEITSITLHTVWTNRIFIIDLSIKQFSFLKGFVKKNIFKLMKLQLHSIIIMDLHTFLTVHKPKICIYMWFKFVTIYQISRYIYTGM